MSAADDLAFLDGLDDEEAGRRAAAGLANGVPGQSSRTLPQILRANLVTRFNAILGALLVVVLIVGPPQDALFGVVLISNALIGIIQEVRAKRTLDRLVVLSAPRARVVRSGRVREVAVAEVVLGDLVELHPGDQVVVDGVLVATDGLELDESLLTGESEPVDKALGAEVLSGGFVTAGTGYLRAHRVGAELYARRLADEARQFDLVHSELRIGIDRILRLVTWVILPAAALLVSSQFLWHASVAEAVRGSVAGIGAMVPEGLVLLVLPGALLPAAVIAIEEQIRPDAAAALDYLAAEGVTVKDPLRR